jgi:hypothetical protein
MTPSDFPIARIKAILLSPRTEWPLIEAETADVASIYRTYLIWLAGLSALATFIGTSIVGIGGFGMTFRVPLLSGLASAVVTVVLTLLMIYVLAWVADALAPKFGGRKHFLSAFKLLAYASTASLVASVVYIVPSLSILALLGSLYSVYLLFLGLPVMMKCPPARALPYTAVLLVCGFVAGLAVAALSVIFLPSPASMGGGAVKIETPQGSVTVDTGKLEALAKQMEASGRKAEEAARSGDPAAAANAAAKAMAAAAAAVAGATGGQPNRTPTPAADLKAMLPDTLGGLTRDTWEASSGGAMGMPGSMAKASYADGDRRIDIEITDIGGLAGLAAMAAMLGGTSERETQDMVEKTYREGKRVVREKASKTGGRSEYQVILENGVVVGAEGSGVEFDVVKRAVTGLALKQLEAVAKAN